LQRTAFRYESPAPIDILPRLGQIFLSFLQKLFEIVNIHKVNRSCHEKAPTVVAFDALFAFHCCTYMFIQLVYKERVNKDLFLYYLVTSKVCNAAGESGISSLRHGHVLQFPDKLGRHTQANWKICFIGLKSPFHKQLPYVTAVFNQWFFFIKYRDAEQSMNMLIKLIITLILYYNSYNIALYLRVRSE